MSARHLLLVVVSAICAACMFFKTISAEKASEVEQIQAILKKQADSKAESILRYKYKGNVVYLALMPCCDRYNLLLDLNYRILCAPSGGFTGNGDGKCIDFESLKQEEKLLWQK